LERFYNRRPRRGEDDENIKSNKRFAHVPQIHCLGLGLALFLMPQFSLAEETISPKPSRTPNMPSIMASRAMPVF
jgi:hypothetical protein